MQSFIPQEYADDLALYLRSRFHPGKPHIEVLGPKPPEIDDSSIPDEDPFADTQSEIVGLEGMKGKVVFDFVPNRAHYSMTITDQKENLETVISFYIRISEGSVENLINDDMKPKEYVLTKDELEKSFKKYKITIHTDTTSLNQDISVDVDGKLLDKSSQEHQKKVTIVKNTTSLNKSLLILKIKDKSDLFLHADYKDKEKATSLDSQDYEITIRRIFTKLDNKKYHLSVTVTNESGPRNPSSIPTMEIRSVKDNGVSVYETNQECMARLKEELKDERFPKWTPRFFNRERENWEIYGSTYGFLMEFNMEENGINSTTEPYEEEYEKEIENIVNVVYDSTFNKTSDGRFVGSVKFKDNILFHEKIPKMASGGKPSDIFKKNDISAILAKVIEEKMGYRTFHKFQDDSISEIQKALKKPDDASVLISARTGGGKTEAFMIPIINYCIEKSTTSNSNGTKAIIFYPRKALANDQASRIIKILYHVNQVLPKKITIGILHGDVEKGTEEQALEDPQAAGIPLACPECEGTLIPTSSTEVKCNKCAILLDFVLSLTRDPIFGTTPDIIVTNPEILQYVMMLSPQKHGIFGREIGACTKCHRAYNVGKRTCVTPSCTGKIEKVKPMPPKFIVFDEIHMFAGTYGINSSYFLSRLKSMIKRYAKNTHGIDPCQITMIGSSATMSNASYFSEIFFNMDSKSISIIPKDDQTKNSYYEEGLESILHRYHFFIMPHAYRPISTLAKSIGYLQERSVLGKPPQPFFDTRNTTKKPLQILGFVNYTADSTQLIDAVEREFTGSSMDIWVGGHSTDFEKGLRASSEKDFNQQLLHVIFATPTLEVGVDFRTVNCVFIFGFPFSFNEYVQRIGRGGRREATLVVTVCQPWKPIDQFFYSDARKKISQQHKYLEPIPITRDNPDAIGKHLRATILDIICSMDDSQSIIENISNLMSFMTMSKNEIIEDALRTLNIKSEEEDYKNITTEFIDELIRSSNETKQTGGKVSMFTKFFEEYDPEYGMTNYRNSESNVYVKTIWEPM